LGTGFHPDLTGRENIFLNASILGISRREIARQIDAIIDFADIGPFIDVQVRNYSSGMVIRLGFAVTTVLEPEILLIDEVLAVGDQNFQRKCIARLEELQQMGVTLFFVSHSMESVQRLCRRAIWLVHGQVQADGDPVEVGGAYLDAQTPAGQRHKPKFGQADHTRWGTFQIEITKVELLNQDGSSPSFFKSGNFFRLRMHYAAHELISKPTFGFAIFRSDGVQVNSPNSAHDGLRLESIDGMGYVDFTVEQLPLNQGDYELTVAIYSQDLDIAYDHHHRRYPLSVRAPGVWAEDGVIHISGQWLINPAPSRD
jgi:lipopolysaccharide transport system ATP-binding protein